MDKEVWGHKIFSSESQVDFANLSGDRNPKHMDPSPLRGIREGAPVVHGIHSALVVLELAERQLPPGTPLASLKATFNKLVFVGDLIEYQLKSLTKQGATIVAMIGGVMVSRFTLTFGKPEMADFEFDPVPLPIGSAKAVRDLPFEQLAGQSGCMGAPASDSNIAAAFPGASSLWSLERVSAMLSITLLVGMVCPGLNSLLSSFALHASELEERRLSYRVASVDKRYKLVGLQVRGSGVHGTVDSFARPMALSDLCAADQPVRAAW